MADDLVNRTTAIMMPQYKKDFVDAVAKKRVEWFALKRAGAIENNMGGRKIEWRARLETDTPFAFLGGMEGNTPTVENHFQVAELEWRGMAHAFAITYAEKVLCKQEWQIIKLLSALTENMTEDWMQEWQTQFYGDGTRLSNSAFHGIDASIESSALTYANISQTTYTNWDCQRVDATGFAADPLNFIQRIQIDCAKGNRGGRDRSEVDLMLCTATDYRVVTQHEMVKQRYEQDVEMAKAGFKNIAIFGVPLVWSEGCAANKLYALNLKNFEFQIAGPDAIETGTEETVGFPKITLGHAFALHQLLNKNPRGSGLLYNTGS